jgi:3-oxoacyl-[acyl-carrier protein] reductase
MKSAARICENQDPIGRVATPEEFAPMVMFLCSEAASYITGQTVAIDGDLIASTY